jgi:hypothetical protein
MRGAREGRTDNDATDRRSLLLGAVSWVTGLTPAFAGQCLEDLRTIELDGATAVRLRDYNCRTNSGEVRIQFQRLDNTAAASLFTGTMPPRLSSVLGHPRIIKNEVLTTFQTIITRFSNKVLGEGNSLELVVETPRAGKGTSENLGDFGNFRLPTLGSSNPIYFPQPSTITQYARRSGVPAGFHRYSNRLIWKYMTLSDVSAFEANLRSQNINIGRDQPLSSEIVQLLKRSLGLIQHVTRQGWPEDFIVVLGTLGLDEGGCEVDFEYFPRELLVDVAIIENSGSAPVTLSEFRGGRSGTTALRALSQQGAARVGAVSAALGVGELRLSPGQRAAVPVRLLFASTDFLKSRLESEPGGPKPRQAHYIFGPELSIASFALNAETMELTRPSANYLALKVTLGEHCCPYLFVWDPIAKKWRVAQKIISEANGQSHEMTSVMHFAGLVSRFRIGELEPELAFIRDVRLVLALRDGNSIELKVDSRRPALREGRYWKIYFGEQIEFRFALPRRLNKAAVMHSVLSVTGYYERYSRLASAASRTKDVLGDRDLERDELSLNRFWIPKSGGF